MILKLRNRLVRIIMIFVAVIMLLAFVSIFAVTFMRVRSENMEKITSKEIVTVFSEGQAVLNGQELSDALVINRISPALGVYFNLITDGDGVLVYIDSALNLDHSVYEKASAIALGSPGGGTVELNGRMWQYMSSPAATSLSYDNVSSQVEQILHRFLDITDSINLLHTLAITLFCLYIFLMGIFFFMAKFFANRSVRPMAEALENQHRFIADASHELKTPISTLGANLEVLYASREERIQDQLRWLDNSKKVLHRMTALIKDMLELAKVDEYSEKPLMKDINVNDMIEDVLDYFQPAASHRQIEIVEKIDAALYAYSDRGLLQQVLEILMDNAIRYTDDHGEIRIQAGYEKGALALRIGNTGPGITSADIHKIFDRFYRGDKARAYSDGSYGLGLSIAQSAVHKLGGSLSVQSDCQMTTFTLKIPKRR